MMARRKGLITLAWDDPNEAEAVANLLYQAADRPRKDQGFYDDAEEIMRQVREVRAEEAWDEVHHGS